MKNALGTVIAAVILGAVGWATLVQKRDGVDSTKGEPMVAVVAPDLKGNAILGKQAFDAKCSACHGPNAAGQEGVGPPLVHKYYEPSHHGDAAFLSAVRSGVRQHHWRFGDMPPVDGLTQGDVIMIIDYIRALQRENGII